MSRQSLIYRHILLYRFMMNVLYGGKYKARFEAVISQLKVLPIKDAAILELCFGDTYIADWCIKAGYTWKGIDINQHFVSEARKHGYDAYFEDLSLGEALPQANVCVMMGSLYHFHPNEYSLLKKMFAAATYVIISEPVSNLSSKKGVIGFLARRAANAGKGNEEFRYDTASFLKTITTYSNELNYDILSSSHQGKDLIITLTKRNGRSKD